MKQLPKEWAETYEARKEAIRRRLQDFAEVPASEHFYELAFCILTPQSSARNAEATIAELIDNGFLEQGFDPTPHLRDPSHYIRFHITKGKRLLHVREVFPELAPHLSNRTLPPQALRELVLASIPGLGMKESSHFLRNIGVTSLAILDRHIYRHLTRLKVIEEPPKSGPTKKRYLEIEEAWHKFANDVGISLDELDLLFWSMETGEIRK